MRGVWFVVGEVFLKEFLFSPKRLTAKTIKAKNKFRHRLSGTACSKRKASGCVPTYTILLLLVIHFSSPPAGADRYVLNLCLSLPLITLSFCSLCCPERYLWEDIISDGFTYKRSDVANFRSTISLCQVAHSYWTTNCLQLQMIQL